MSLLMDALRKAEEAKQQASAPPAPTALASAASELTLAPIGEPAPASPQIAAHDAGLSAATWESSRRMPAAAERTPQSARATVRNAFAAKVTPKSRRVRWPALALGIGTLSLGAYFCWPPQATSSGLPPLSAQTSQAPAAASVLVPPAPSAAAPLPGPTSAPTLAPSAAAENARLAPRARPSRPAATATRPVAPTSALRLARSAPSSNPALERAYEGLQGGRLDEAQRDYQQVLRSDAKNTDALLGLATIAARQGQTELAQGYYQRALESDPNDATAQAGLINTRGPADPMLSESRLKSALAGQPESSALHFALGNLYARQNRWSEAQQAYFRAYSGEPDNADIVFNLAVSLDHLHQNKLAAQYYRMALDSTRMRSHSFDRQQVSQRIAELQP
jgi:Tfp pilus assembly protein PilF